MPASRQDHHCPRAYVPCTIVSTDVSIQVGAHVKPTSKQLAMLTTWQQHTHAEFVLKDPHAALATMSGSPYVI
jgi:hypothetical protein